MLQFLTSPAVDTNAAFEKKGDFRHSRWQLYDENTLFTGLREGGDGSSCFVAPWSVRRDTPVDGKS
jgi:hypothetical protein